MTVQTRRLMSSTGLAALLACLGSPALAQDAPSAAAPSGETAGVLDNAGGDIIVTAQRREQRLQDVPVAVTALTGVQLERAGTLDLRGIAGQAPGLNIAMFPGDRSSLQISVRGLGSVSSNVLQDPAVGIYVDGFYLARSTGANVGLVDLARVEVLRGPQGTLFGRNTIGGAISLVTQEPTDRLEGSVEAKYGNYNTFGATGVFNAPLIPGKLDLRVVASHDEHSGYVKNLFVPGEESNDDNIDYFRFTLKATPSDAVELSLYGDYYIDHFTQEGSRLIYAAPGSLITRIPALVGNPTDNLNNYIGGDFYKNYSNFNPRNATKVYSGLQTTSIDLGFGTFKNILGYRKVDAQRSQDIDGTPYDLINVPMLPLTSRTVSDEAQLFSKGLQDKLDWIMGIYYFHEKGVDATVSQPVFQLLNNTSFNGDYGIGISKSVFGQASYKLLDNLSVTGGVRYVVDIRKARWQQYVVGRLTGVTTCIVPAGLVNPATAGSCISVQKRTTSRTVPFTVGLDYKPASDVLLYGKFSQGYRSGGFPLAGGNNVNAFLPLKPEKLVQEEAGLKAQWLERRLLTNIALYHSTYQNIQNQRQATNPNTGVPFQQLANIGSARVYGVEAEATVVLGGLRMHGAYAYQDSKTTSGVAPFFGKPLAYVPRQTASASADYIAPFSGGDINFHIEYNWRSRVQYNITSNKGTPGYILSGQDAFGLLNGQLGFDLKAFPITVSVYANNITNKHYYGYATDSSTSLGSVIGYLGDPRTFGVRAKYSF